MDLIARKDFSPTKGHRVCSLHFSGRRKTDMNQLPYINAPKPTQTMSPTGKRTLLEKGNIDDVVSSLQEKVVEQSVNYETINDDLSDQTAANKNVWNEKLQAENEQQRTDLAFRLRDFSVKTFMNNDSLFRFYTGIQDYKTFKIFLIHLCQQQKTLLIMAAKHVQKD